MQIKHLDKGLHQTLEPIFRSKGLSAEEARVKSAQHLEGARAHFRAALAEKQPKTFKQIKEHFEKASKTRAHARTRSNPLARLSSTVAQVRDRKGQAGTGASTLAISAALRDVAKWAKKLP